MLDIPSLNILLSCFTFLFYLIYKTYYNFYLIMMRHNMTIFHFLITIKGAVSDPLVIVIHKYLSIYTHPSIF